MDDILELGERLKNPEERKDTPSSELMKACMNILSEPFYERIQYESQFRHIVDQLQQRGVMSEEKAKLNRKNFYDAWFLHMNEGKVIHLVKYHGN